MGASVQAVESSAHSHFEREPTGAERDVLAYMTFPTAHRAKLHPANRIERLNGEIKRRTNVVDIYSSEAAIRRLVGAF